MAAPASDFARDLAALEAELKRLEAEYHMFFAGRLPRPPWETRRRVEAIVKRLDRERAANYADRFRFSTLQSRLTAFIDLWDRGLRAREEGRAGPFTQARPAPAPPQAPSARQDGVMKVATFNDPASQPEKLHELYDSLAEARRAAGQEPIPFDRFSELVNMQVSTLKSRGNTGVAFRVALKDGKVALTVKGVKEKEEDRGEE